MADSFEALDDESGEKIFLKAYHSPGPRTSWYFDYLEYVDALNERIEASPVKDFCVLSRKSFTCNPDPTFCDEEFFYQVFDFVEGSMDLSKLLGNELNDLSRFSWQERVLLARVFVYSMGALHNAGIVHCDLKPENIMLTAGGTTAMRYVPRLIDMDRSIIIGTKAPWHGEETYVGTPGYKSPEHLRNEVPIVASDVFTMAVILCEILAGCHPYNWLNIDEDEYNERVLSGEHIFIDKPLRLLGLIGNQEDTDRLASTILQCLSPYAENRPTEAALHKLLKNSPSEIATGRSSAAEDVTGSESDTRTCPKSASTLSLKGTLGCVTVAMEGWYGRSFIGRVSDEAEYCSAYQYRFYRKSGCWFVSPHPQAKHLGIVNGCPIPDDGVELHDGDTLAVESRTSHARRVEVTVLIG